MEVIKKPFPAQYFKWVLQLEAPQRLLWGVVPFMNEPRLLPAWLFCSNPQRLLDIEIHICAQ